MSSKVLYLWSVVEQGYAYTHDEAQAIFMRLMEESEQSSAQLSFLAQTQKAPTPWVMTFAEHLQCSAQTKTTIALESRQPFMHCTKGLAKYANNRLLVLELPNLPEGVFLPMLLEIIEIAKNLNVVVFDDEKFGIYFLPSGDILPEEKENVWFGYIDYWESQRNTTFRNLGEVKDYIEPLIKALMEDKAFLLSYEEIIEKNYQGYGYNYTKITEIGNYHVNFFFDTTKYGYRLGMGISLYLRVPNFDYTQIPFIEKKSKIINNNNGLPIRYPITSLVPREESSALDQKITDINTKADANAAMSAVSPILLPLLPLLNGQIQDLVLLMKKFFTIQDWAYDNIAYLFAFRLANDAEFDNLVNDVTILIQKKPDSVLEKDFLAFVKFLREEVKPLV